MAWVVAISRIATLGNLFNWNNLLREILMRKIATGLTLAVLLTSGAYAATTMSAAPTESWTVKNYYKQDVYDPNQSKIGTIDDVLVDKAGKVTGLSSARAKRT